MAIYRAEKRAARTPEQIEAERARNKRYVEAHAEEVRERGAQWRARVGPEYFRQWRADNPDKVKAHNRRQVLRRHGITPEEYDEALAVQGGVCAICLNPPPEEDVLRQDHDHGTGGNRGLLCHNCNVGIGHLRDDPEIVAAALEYLLQWSLKDSMGA
jgi:hypothetical protein